MDSIHTILKSAKHFFAGTALSRMSGLLRDIVMAVSFGAAPEIAAFMVAYRLANLLRRLFGEGNLQSGFVPHFETLRKESLKSAFSFYRDSAYSISAMLILAILAIEGVLWPLLGHLPEEWREIAELTMWMAPGLLFICLSALNTALLQCQKKYFISAAAPLFFNAVWIAFALVSSRFTLPEAVRFLSLGMTFAFAAQWSITALAVRKEAKEHLDLSGLPHFFSPEWRKILRPMGFGILGVGAMQINSALDAIFARIADLSGPTYLWYAIRVQQLPLALFGIALSGAILPPLSRAMREGNSEQYRVLLSSSLRQAAALMTPCTFGLFALGASGLNLLYGRGHFSSADIQETLYCLWAYGMGLVPATFVFLLAAGSFAKKSYGSPAFASLFSVGFNCALNVLFVFGLHWGAVSIALATSASAWINCALLLRAHSIEPGFLSYFGKIVFASVFSAVITIGCARFFGDGTYEVLSRHAFSFARNLLPQFGQFAFMGSLFAASFLAMARMLRVQEVFLLFSR